MIVIHFAWKNSNSKNYNGTLPLFSPHGDPNPKQIILRMQRL